jgi:hypothetical protein
LQQSRGEEGAEVPAATEVLPLAESTNTETKTETKSAKTQAERPPRERRERGPPADGIPSKNKVMVANLPYDLSEEKVRIFKPYKISLTSNFFLAQGTLRCL